MRSRHRDRHRFWTSFRESPRKPPWVLPLDAIRKRHHPLVGGKAASLARLMRGGFRVPAGFCITRTACDQFLAACPGHAEFPSALARSGPDGEKDPAALSRGMLALTAEARMPPPVEAAILRAWRMAGEEHAYAVRSSATVEDGAEHSFAGQFDSFLDVRGWEALLAAVRACWRALYSERTLAYQVKAGLSPEQASMAVIVQQMVPAEIAGVLFTVDPVPGGGGRMVLEGTRGLGDQLVSGRANPDRRLLDKTTLRIVGRDNPDDGGCLDEALARRLGQLGLRVERLFGRPQDIEWAVAGGEVFLLQARPVTTGRRVARHRVRHNDAGAWADRQIWGNLNAGEVMPDVMTPVTWSMVQKLLGRIAGSVFWLVGADMTRAPIVGLVGGRIYFNANTGLAAIKPFSWLLKRSPDMAHALGGGPTEWQGMRPQDIPAEDLPDLGFRWPRYLLSWPRCFASLITHSPRRGDAWTVRLKAHQDALAQADIESLSTPALGSYFEEVLEDGLLGMDLLYLVTQAVWLFVFQSVCRNWLEDPDLAMGYRLFAGLGDLPEARVGRSLWELATLADADEATKSLVRSDLDWAAIRARLEQAKAGRRFLTAWDVFMTEHGHHCRGELELFNARWSETPDYILGFVRGHLNSIGQTDLVERQRRLAAERIRLTEECCKRLRNPLKRWIFSSSLRRAQRLAINREEWKNQAVRYITLLRRVLLRLGKLLCHDGTLARPDDVFFLQIPEIRSVADGRAAFDVTALIDRRRSDYQRNLPLNPPPVVFGRFDPDGPEAPAVEAGATVLTGIPVFPGVVRGPARVILRANNHEQVLPGEILVAPFTDPAWTPYFIAAAGVVMDQGGILSHGSIVAREFGLPTVTSVGSATRLVRTGDLIQVDGTRGRVVILERGT